MGNLFLIEFRFRSTTCWGTNSSSSAQCVINSRFAVTTQSTEPPAWSKSASLPQAPSGTECRTSESIWNSIATMATISCRCWKIYTLITSFWKIENCFPKFFGRKAVGNDEIVTTSIFLFLSRLCVSRLAIVTFPETIETSASFAPKLNRS